MYEFLRYLRRDKYAEIHQILDHALFEPVKENSNETVPHGELQGTFSFCEHEFISARQLWILSYLSPGLTLKCHNERHQADAFGTTFFPPEAADFLKPRVYFHTKPWAVSVDESILLHAAKFKYDDIDAYATEKIDPALRKLNRFLCPHLHTSTIFSPNYKYKRIDPRVPICGRLQVGRYTRCVKGICSVPAAGLALRADNICVNWSECRSRGCHTRYGIRRMFVPGHERMVWTVLEVSRDLIDWPVNPSWQRQMFNGV